MFKLCLAAGGDHVAMEIGQHIAALERDGELLAEAAEAAGLDATVPACPGWRVRDLVRHQAYVHGLCVTLSNSPPMSSRRRPRQRSSAAGRQTTP
jgi:hypothetical protein